MMMEVVTGLVRGTYKAFRQCEYEEGPKYRITGVTEAFCMIGWMHLASHYVRVGCHTMALWLNVVEAKK